MQDDTHVFQGMKQNTHPIKQDSNFLWEAHNIRLTNREDNTQFSITNEKGTKDTGLSFDGIYLGHCVLGKYLVVFTAEREGDSYIYRVEKNDDDTFTKVILFKGKALLDPDYPIEAIGNVETEYVQKVYWVDGKHQPRYINIKMPELKNWGNLDDYTHLYSPKHFDFIPELELKENVTVTPHYGDGQHQAGVIQYAFTYYNKYGAESNIFYVTPIHYVSHTDRGDINNTVAVSFRITLSNIQDFDFIRVYSISRTSIQGQPTVKIVKDVRILNNAEVSIQDDGTQGDVIDPSLLLYIGGKSIVSNCIEVKDNTLFFGNTQVISNKLKDEQLVINTGRYDEHNNLIIEKHSIYNLIKYGETSERIRYIPLQSPDSTFYPQVSQLRFQSQTFKSGEWYRLGVQFQYKDGTWTDPIFISDYTVQKLPSYDGYYLGLPVIENVLKKEVVDELLKQGFIKARGVVVFPSMEDRKVIAQGILCPTVFNSKSRALNSPFVQSSWFLRPFSGHITRDDKNSPYGAFARNKHLQNLGFDENDYLSTELGNSTAFAAVNNAIIAGNNTEEDNYFVDQNILTFHSPDVEFNDSLFINDDYNYKLNLKGIVQFISSAGDMQVTTSTPTLSSIYPGFIKPEVYIDGINTEQSSKNIISGPFYIDYAMKKEKEEDDDGNTKYVFKPIEYPFKHMVYLWDSGSLNNDIKRPEGEGTRTAQLQYKKISNLKVAKSTTWLNNTSVTYSIQDLKVFNSNEVSLVKLKAPIKNKNKELLYYGNVDSAVLSTVTPYALYSNVNEDLEILEEKFQPLQNINDNITKEDTTMTRVKYKSTPHIVLSLGDDALGKSIILPSVDGKNKTSFGDPLFWNKETTNTDDITKVGVVISHEDDVPFGIWLWSYFDKYPDKAKLLKKDTYIIDYYGSSKHTKKGVLYKSPSEYVKWMTFEEVDITAQDNKNIYKYYNDDGAIEIYKAKFIATKYYLTLSETVYPENTTGTVLKQDNIDVYINTTKIDITSPYLFLADICREESEIVNAFGGNSELDLQKSLWFPAGNPILLDSSNQNNTVKYEYGDTWYQRYDCLKTYPFTSEDENQLVEIGSFMCESRINIDGRYDRNRGQLSNLNMTPQNFNLINSVYSQRDNFFNYRILPKDFYKQDSFKNQITWSKEKIAGEDVDTWTNVTLANTLDLDGSKGEITAIKSFNELLVAFQEQAISKINFNSRVQIPTSDGVPIEIANSYKVDGYDIYSNIIGCQDKNSIINTEDGIYFIDNNSNSLYKFNGQLSNISDTLGMKSWFKDNKFNYKWKPIPGALNKNNGIRSFYDYENGDIYFTPGWDNIDSKYTTRDALCYSNKLQAFSSLMSYGGTQAMFNYCGDFYSLRFNPNESEEKIKLYQNNAGDYNDFYGETKGWDFSFISNGGSAVTKVFDTLELRTDVYNSSKELLNSCPMNFIKADNEYQNTGEVTLDRKNMRKKFRIWRGLIPRNKGTRERIRNPWTKITLGWNPLLKQESENSNNSAIIHDVTVRYTV